MSENKPLGSDESLIADCAVQCIRNQIDRAEAIIRKTKAEYEKLCLDSATNAVTHISSFFSCYLHFLAKLKDIESKAVPCDFTSVLPSELLRQAIRSRCKDLIAALIEGGIDVNSKCDGVAPLHTAITEGCFCIVEQLLDAGADVNQLDDGGATPLHHAVYKDHAGLIRRLLKAGADKTIKNAAGQTAKEAANEIGSYCADLL